MKILIILTSHDQRGETGKKTGFWLEEFAVDEIKKRNSHPRSTQEDL